MTTSNHTFLKMNNYEIDQLIPQRSPIKMVDKLLDVDGETAVTLFTIQPDNYFLEPDETLAEAGVIEHIAQSASALTGYLTHKQGISHVPIGYIGEVRNFYRYRSPQIGDILRTIVRREGVFDDITCISGETWVSNERIAELQMKLYINSND